MAAASTDRLPPPEGATEIEIEANGLTFHALAAGVGRPVLLLHGFPDTPRSFRHQLKALADAGFRAVAPATRGYPPTGGPGPYDVAQLALDALAILDALGAATHPEGSGPGGLIVGHDWGAATAYAAAAIAPEKIDRIVGMSVPHMGLFASKLLGGDYDQLRRSWYMYLFQLHGLAESAVAAQQMAFIDRLIEDWSPGFHDVEPAAEAAHRKVVLGTPGALAAALGYYRASLNPAGADASLAPLQARALGPIPVPAMVIFGANDGCISPAVCRGMESLFPRGLRFETIEGAGHFVQIEAAREVSELMLGFLGE